MKTKIEKRQPNPKPKRISSERKTSKKEDFNQATYRVMQEITRRSES
jgi:hypothetical protein